MPGIAIGTAIENLTVGGDVGLAGTNKLMSNGLRIMGTSTLNDGAHTYRLDVRGDVDLATGGKASTLVSSAANWAQADFARSLS